MVDPHKDAPAPTGDPAPDPRDVYALVVVLIEEGRRRPPSRNRHFEAWSDPLRRAAYRLFLKLRDLEDDLRLATARNEPVHISTSLSEGGAAEVGAAEEGAAETTVMYALSLPQGRLRRVARLSADEWRLLRALCGDLLEAAQAA